MKDAVRFKAKMAALGELYGKECTKTLADMYWAALKDFSDEEVHRAIESGILVWTCFGRLPTPAEIVGQITRDGADHALSAWEQLQEGVHRAGTYQSVHFEDGKIARVIQLMGGWETVCQWPMDEIQFRRKEFMDSYKALPRCDHGATLAGLCDRQNAALGFAETPAVVIPRELPPPRAAIQLLEAEPQAKPGNGHDDSPQIPVGELLREVSRKLFSAPK